MQLRNLSLVGGLAGVLALSGAVAAQETRDWTGFYAGVFAGYGLDSAAATSSNTDPVTIQVGPGETLTFSGNGSSTRFDSLLGGIQAGYNHQINNFVLGVEGTVGIGGLDKGYASAESYQYVDGADFLNLDAANRTDFSIDWLSTFSGKLGADLGGILLYGKAGVAVANLSSSSSSSTTLDTNVNIGLPNGTFNSSATYSGLRAGVVIGAGVEKMITDAVSVGLEYNYVHLGDVDVPSAGGGIGGIFGGVFGGGGGGTQTFSSNIHTVKASLNYHF